jgi:HEAT repeats
MSRRVGALELSPDQAQAMLNARRWAEAEQAFRDLIGQSQVINYEYDEWLRSLSVTYQHLALPYERAIVHVYLHDMKTARAELSTVNQPVLLAHIAQYEKRWTEAAQLFRSASLPMHAAIALERAERFEDAAVAWQQLAVDASATLPAYEAALVHFNCGMCLARIDPHSPEARRALIDSQRKLEQVADDFETTGELERAFDCFAILLKMGKENQSFENLSEGYVNCIRVLASDNLKFYALQYYEDFVRLALERDEYQAAATILQEAGEYSARVGLPYAQHYQGKAAKTWRRCAEHIESQAAPPQMIENALLAAASQFSSIGDYGSVRAMFDKLGTLELGERSKRRYAAIANRFSTVGAAKADAPGLPEYLKQQQAYADIWFADLLEYEMAGDPAAVAASIFGDLRYPDPNRRRALLILLGTAHAKRTNVYGTQATSCWLAELLGELQSYPALAPLEKLFDSTDIQVRCAAVRALRYLYFKRSFVLVQKALNDENTNVHDSALTAISGLHFPHAFKPLARLYKETGEFRVKRACLDSIGKIASVEAAELLVEVLRSDDTQLRDAAFSALRSVDNSDALPILRQQAEVEQNAEVRERILSLLRRHT